MPLKARNSARRRRKNPDEERPAEPASSSARVMAPTRMKLRMRRSDNAAAGAAGRGAALEEEEAQRSRESGNRRKNASRSSTAATSSSSLSPPASSASTSARPHLMAAEEASPDSKCPICLDRFNNLAFLDRCKHRFCFPCIQEWSHKKPECPLCKQPFASIFYRTHAEDDFKEYTLRSAPPSSSVAATVAMVAAMASAARSSHQMRLMLRRHRVSEAGETTTRRRRRERGARRAEERAGGWEWYLDSPPLPLPPLPPLPTLPHPPVVAEDSEDGEERRIRGGADLAERGVIFEGLTGLGGAVAPVAPNDRASRRLMTRLAARQRLQREGGTVRRLRERETVAFRRGLYRCGIRVRGVVGIHGNEGQRDITADSFRRNPAHLNRLRPWLRRELTVLYGSHTSLVDIVQRIITARLARHGLENTPNIEEELRPFLLSRTEHFLHELISFARSPLSLENYDLQAVYEPPDAAMELDGMSSSSDGSSVIAISEGEDEERAAGGGSEERLGREVGTHNDPIQTASVLSLSGWDDETPGPSYSTAEPSSSFSPALPEAANQDVGERQEEEDECLIVGYKKPIAERTPELVQLSSDTEAEEVEKKKEEEAPPPPSATPPLSYLPTIPPSTSGTYREEQDKGQKVGEATGQRLRARSWSGSSGRSRSSMCTLSPATPGENERRQEMGSWRDRKSTSEAAREKRRKRRQERSSDRHRKSGTLFNPNRSIYPAMMRHRSPSPFDSSADSSSLPSPSPPDSSWEYPCAQVSPLTSSASASSPSLSSSSPRPPPPQPRTPPTPTLSPSGSAHHGEKPGGKRKYKSRHLDNNVKDPTWRPSGSGSSRKEKRKEWRKRRERDRGRRRERHRRASSGYGGESSRRSRQDRSPSVEIIYEGTITADGAQPVAHKRRRKRNRKAQQSSSPVIITLDSDSSHDYANNKNSGSISSSPFSSQQTVDFSDLPPLPLVHSASVGGVLDGEIGELPVDILDRGYNGSDTEPAGRSKAARPIAIDNSDHEVDVENLDNDTEGPIKATDPKTPNADSHRNTGTVSVGSRPMGEQDAARVMTDLLHKRRTEASTSDSHLLASILSDLDRITAPKREAPAAIDASCSPDSKKRRYRDSCAVSQAHQQQDGWKASFPEELPVQNRDATSMNSPSSLEQWKEGRDAPPLLRQASPVRSYNRNTPPPLKHKDAGSPRRSPILNNDLHSDHSSVDPVLRSLNPTDSRLPAKLPNDSESIPPISTLKRHLTSTLELSGEPANASTVSAALSKVRALTADFDHSGHKPPVAPSSSSFVCESTHMASRYYSSALHSTRASTMGISSDLSPVDLNPVNSSSDIDFHSAAGWSKEKPAHAHSTSAGCRNKTQISFWASPVDFHRFSRAAGGPPAGSGTYSGVNSHDTSFPLSVTDSRTQNAASPPKSHSSSKLTLIGSTAAASATPSTVNLHPVDFHSSSPASGGRTGGETSSVVNCDGKPPAELDCRGPVPPANLHSSCLIDGHLNHRAFSSSSSAPSEHSITFNASHRKSELGMGSNLFQPPNHVDPHSKHNLPADSEPPPPKYAQRDFEPHTDNHVNLEDNSTSPTHTHPYERSAT